MFEDPLCSLSESLGIHGMDAACSHKRTCVRMDTPMRPHRSKYFILGNFITDAIMCPSHRQPSGHYSLVCPFVRLPTIVRVTTLFEVRTIFYSLL